MPFFGCHFWVLFFGVPFSGVIFFRCHFLGATFQAPFLAGVIFSSAIFQLPPSHAGHQNTNIDHLKPREGDQGVLSPVWLSCRVLLLHWDNPTIATILAPRLERRFLLAVTVTESALPRALFSRLYISPLMLELRTTFLPDEELPSPLNMVRAPAGTGSAAPDQLRGQVGDAEGVKVVKNPSREFRWN